MFSCCVVATEKGWEFDEQGNVFKPKPAQGMNEACALLLIKVWLLARLV